MSSHNVVTEYEVMFCFLTLDLEWKIIYVGSAESEEYDQVLDSVLVGPVPAGRHMFVFQVRLFLVNMYAKYVSKQTLSYGPHPFGVKSQLLLHSLFICFYVLGSHSVIKNATSILCARNVDVIFTSRFAQHGVNLILCHGISDG